MATKLQNLKGQLTFNKAKAQQQKLAKGKVAFSKAKAVQQQAAKYKIASSQMKTRMADRKKK